MIARKLNAALVVAGALMVVLPILLGATIKEPLRVYREFIIGETKQRMLGISIDRSLSSPPLGPPTPLNFTRTEGLIVKVVVHPELTKYMRFTIMRNRRRLNLGDFIEIRFLDGKIEVVVEGETVASSELLNDRASIINLTIKGYPLKVVVARCAVPDVLGLQLSHELKEEALSQFNQSPFVKWLKENGLSYMICETRPMGRLNCVEELSYHLEGAFIELSVEGLRVYHYIRFKNPCTIRIDAPEEVLVSSNEKGKYLVLFELAGSYERGGFSIGHLFKCPGVKFKQFKPFVRRELNVTSELVDQVMEAMKGNKLTRELLKICNVESISGYAYTYRRGRERRVSVVLVSEKLERCKMIINIDLIERGGFVEREIRDVYVYYGVDYQSSET